MIVRRQNDVGRPQALAERGGAFAAEALVADFGDLVDQVHVEIDRQTGSEGEPRPHARRIRIDRHVEILAELGEFLDKARHPAHAGAIDPGDERDILATRKRAVNRPAEPERKRHANAAVNRAAIRHFRTGQQADQGRFSRAVGAENSEIVPRANSAETLSSRTLRPTALR